MELVHLGDSAAEEKLTMLAHRHTSTVLEAEVGGGVGRRGGGGGGSCLPACLPACLLRPAAAREISNG